MYHQHAVVNERGQRQVAEALAEEIVHVSVVLDLALLHEPKHLRDGVLFVVATVQQNVARVQQLEEVDDDRDFHTSVATVNKVTVEQVRIGIRRQSVLTENQQQVIELAVQVADDGDVVRRSDLELDHRRVPPEQRRGLVDHADHHVARDLAAVAARVDQVRHVLESDDLVQLVALHVHVGDVDAAHLLLRDGVRFRLGLAIIQAGDVVHQRVQEQRQLQLKKHNNNNNNNRKPR
ncbi:hypothetical protein ON010_g11225 [Phytophthora cinnamomi]|nr:hypothetical protein ON010_g11225 [Phytophthora cinnamomi]